ncbi:hypothetical protein BC629DRAFT_1537433 [Irpex lacteus]|nr:hypothetical protein BC629DRAFT_1537433 [Irpex lacteus]
MPHVRLNEREANPNPYVNFITPLPGRDAADEEDARQLLRALAAQYQYNKVFLGATGRTGPGANGRFQPISWLLGTFCHEVRSRELQRKGYYGDGLWSSGQRLADSSPMGGPGLTEAELPEYLCGGAHSRKPPSTQRRRRRRVEGPSNYTGRQTAKKRKAGSRGSGRALNDDVEDEDAKKAGAGFRKQAGR